MEENENIVVGLVPVNEQRLYDYITGKSNLYPSRKGVKKALKNGKVRLNLNIASGAEYIKEGDVIELMPPDSFITKIYPYSLDVLYEDDYLAIVNKPAGMITSGNYYKTLVNALPCNLKKSSREDALVDFQPIHRLDRSTSGLVIVAKTYHARVKLADLLEKKAIDKFYRAMAHGRLYNFGCVTIPVNGKEAKSTFRVLENFTTSKFGELMLLELSPVTGRTHQLRKHFAALGCSLVGDKLYIGERKTVMDKGLFLQAFKLKFVHPITNTMINIELEAPLKFLTFQRRHGIK